MATAASTQAPGQTPATSIAAAIAAAEAEVTTNPTGTQTYGDIAGPVCSQHAHGIWFIRIMLTVGLTALVKGLGSLLPSVFGALKAMADVIPDGGDFVLIFAIYNWCPVALLVPAGCKPTAAVASRLVSGAVSVPVLCDPQVIAHDGVHGAMRGKGAGGVAYLCAQLCLDLALATEAQIDAAVAAG